MERARKSSDEEQNVDRLSALPDGVICHILSFLRTQESVQTSVLAKRWRTLWAHVPFLFFYFLMKRFHTKSFPGMVCAFMLRHKVQSLNTFHLECRVPYDNDEEYDYDYYDDDDNGPCYELEACTATVVERNVQNLLLELRVEVPRCLLTCKTLADLTVKKCVSIPPTAPIFLPNLKKLYLYYLECEVDFTRLLSGCPVLEELIIEGIRCRDPMGCYISSPTLKWLTISTMPASDMFDNLYYTVTINTPALRYLKLSYCFCKHISISLCTSLVEADICIYTSFKPDDFVLKFLDSIRNVKCLKLKVFLDKICDGLISGSIAKFGNLTKLELCANGRFLSKFLESADHLQVLIISCEGVSHSKHMMEPIEERWACLLYSLRIVRIDDFRHTEQSFNMVRYILGNALVLERMEIYWDRWHDVGLKEKSDAIQRISLFRQGSMECELSFS